MPARGQTAQHVASRTERFDSDDEFASPEPENTHIPTPDSAQEKTSKPTINRAIAKKTTKSRTTVKTGATKKTAAKPKAQREALKDRTNIGDGSDTEEVEEFDDMEDGTVAKSKVKTSRAKAQDAPVKRARATKPKKAQPEDGAARKTKTTKRAGIVEPMNVIPETQPERHEDVSQSIEVVEDDNMDIDHEPTPPRAQRFVQRARSVSQQRQVQPQVVPARARPTSQQPRAYSRGRSASDTERRLPESELKRKLAEMTKKYEDMQLKYESLQELGKTGAESNFDKLKRATDQKAKDANDLIASLKKELSEARKASSTNNAETTRLQTQVKSLKAENEKLSAENKTLQTSLSEAQNEAKSLIARLDAAKKAATSAGPQIPGSAVKNHRDNLNRSQMGGSNLDSAKQAVLKEELYRDLTGLIINSVKRKDGEDEYSCIQTGRNGTLHFHLTVCNDSSVVNPKTPSGLSYEDAEFAYEPFFDEGRDRDLIDILPDYLTEEICFPRNHAVKFYTKVVDSMTKRVVVDED